MRDDVVVTGIGVLSSLGAGAATLVDGLLAGQSGIRSISSFDTASCRSHSAALVRDFDPTIYVDPLKLRKLDEVGRLALVACRLAFEDARLPAGNDRPGILLGTATAGLHSTVRHLQGLSTVGPANVPALGFSNTVGNAAASLCAIDLGLRGPNLTLSQKQASGLTAVAMATGSVRAGRAPAILCGAADDIEEFSFRIFDRFGVLSGSRGGAEACRPFSAARDGFVLGTGAHILVVERTSAALDRGVVPYGQVLGVACGASECRPTSWPHDPEGLVRTMETAIADARISPADVSVVFATANGTDVDRMEARAIERVFGPGGVPVVSVKGALGEYAGAGTAALVTALLGLPRGIVPPTIGCEPLDPLCRVDAVPGVRNVTGRVALVNAVADGGANCCVVVRATR
jgi:3-oxoacyl-[acyl-carrier-protein] synthase II